MKTLISEQEAWSDDLQLPPSHGFLKHDILERICLFLPNQQDCYQACFINQAWCTAATKVLWDSPIFRTPASFKIFLNIIEREKRLALQVKNLTLCLPDTPSTTLFDPVNRSQMDRHMIKDNIMSRPHIIHHLAEYCQQLNSLTIYGWNLGQTDFDKLYSYLPWLKILKVIGTNDDFYQQSQRLQHQSIFQLNTYLPRLSQLTLDGLFPISRTFAHAISVKALNLTSLHLSLYSMDRNILMTLCENDTALDLRELTLTHGAHMNDNFVDNVLRRFSNLRLFCLEGSQHVTANVFKIAMENCQHLQHLEIRQQVMGKPLERFEPVAWNLPADGTDVRTLLIENVWLYDHTLDNIAFYCPILTKLGISNGGLDLTDIGVEALVRASLTFLRHVQLLFCPKVTSNALTCLPMPSLYTLYLESNGDIEPIDIYNVCSRSVVYANEQGLRPNLRQICVVGYENIATSIVGTHAIERLEYQAKRWADEYSADDDELQATKYRITLDQQAIDALAHSDEFVALPSKKVLTGHQIMELAKRLQVPLNQFIQLLDQLTEPEPAAITTNSKPAREIVSEVRTSRVDQLKKSPSQRIRPSTPALWAEAINDPDTLLSHKQSARAKSYDSLVPTSLSPPPQQSSSNSLSSDSLSSRSQSQASDSEFDQENNDKEDWPHLHNNGEHISLGGWGTSDISPWSKKKNASATNAKNGSLFEPINNRTQSRSHSTMNNFTDSHGEMNWNTSSKENIEAHWQTKPMEAPPPRKKGQLTLLDVEADRWGPPKEVIPWDQTKPFVDDVLKNQDETVYWKRCNGNWERLQNNNTTTDAAMAKGKGNSNGRTSFANERKSARFSYATTRSATSTNRSSVNNSNAYPDEQIGFSSAMAKYDSDSTSNNNNRITIDENDTKRYSLSSDDSDVDWDDDDGITIKIGNTGLTCNDGLDGTHGKSNELESKQSKFARSKAPAPIATTPPTYNISFAPTTDIQSASSTSQWRDFADNEKVNKETTTVVSLDETTRTKESKTELLVDTSDSTTIVGTTTWNSHDERNVLHDLYNSISDLDLNSNSSNKVDTMEQETIIWDDEYTNEKDVDQDDRGTIRIENITDVSGDDTLLLLDSTLTPVSDLNSSKNSTDQSDRDHMKFEHPLIDSSTDASTPPLQSKIKPSITSPPLIKSNSSDAFSTVDMFLDNSPTTTTTTATATVASHDDDLALSSTFTDATSTTVSTTTSTAKPAVQSTSSAAAATSDDESSSSAKAPTTDESYLCLSLSTPNGAEFLTLHENSNVKAEVHLFCSQHGVLDKEDAIFLAANKAYMKKKADMVFGDSKKKKKNKDKKKKEKESKKKQLGIISP